MITYEYESLIRTGKWSAHPPANLLPDQSRFSNANIGINIKEKVGRINTSGKPDHMDKQDHFYIHPSISTSKETPG